MSCSFCKRKFKIDTVYKFPDYHAIYAKVKLNLEVLMGI